MNRFLKLVKIAPVMGLFILGASSASLLIINKVRRTQVLIWLTSFFARIFLKILNIRVSVEGDEYRVPEDRNYLMVSNHLSYVDILIIASQARAVFITSVEIGNSFFIGLLCRLGGCYFVERRNIFSVSSELNELEILLKQGFSIVLFPEGTSSDGGKILPIKNTLLVTSMRASVPIQPVCLNYLRVNGSPLSCSNKKYLFWYGDMAFFPHLWELLSIENAAVRMTYLDPLFPHKEVSRKHISSVLYDRLQKAYMPVC